MNNLKEYSNKELIDKIVEKDKEMKELKKQSDAIKAEMQSRGLQVLEDKNIKTTEYYGTDSNNLTVTKSQDMEILNYPALEKIFGKELLEDKVKRTVEVKLEVEKKFKQALIDLFTNDYIADKSLEDFLKEEFKELDTKQLKLLLKKLKGDYKKDKELLNTLIQREDLDAELYYINRIKAFENIKAYVNDEDLEEVTEAVRRYMIVNDTIKITVKYDKEAAEENIKQPR